MKGKQIAGGRAGSVAAAAVLGLVAAVVAVERSAGFAVGDSRE